MWEFKYFTKVLYLVLMPQSKKNQLSILNELDHKWQIILTRKGLIKCLNPTIQNDD